MNNSFEETEKLLHYTTLILNVQGKKHPQIIKIHHNSWLIFHMLKFPKLYHKVHFSEHGVALTPIWSDTVVHQEALIISEPQIPRYLHEHVTSACVLTIQWACTSLTSRPSPFTVAVFSSAFSNRRRHIDDYNAFCKTPKNPVFANMLYLEDYLESEYIRAFIFSLPLVGVYFSLWVVFLVLTVRSC